MMRKPMSIKPVSFAVAGACLLMAAPQAAAWQQSAAEQDPE